jgi:hypothetical protein
MSRGIYTAARGPDPPVDLAHFGRPPRSSGLELETPKNLDFLIAKYLLRENLYLPVFWLSKS